MTFSYDTRCRKEGIIQNKYIIQHIYTYDLNGGLPGKIVCPHIVLSSDCHNHRPILLERLMLNTKTWGCTPLTSYEVLCLMTFNI